jgi:hypothetical protein
MTLLICNLVNAVRLWPVASRHKHHHASILAIHDVA